MTAATLRSLMEKATAAPWQSWRHGNSRLGNGRGAGMSIVAGPERPFDDCSLWEGLPESRRKVVMTDEDADLVVALRNEAPALLARIEELERVLGVCADTMGDLCRAALELGEDGDAVMFAAAERACNSALATTKEGA